MKIGLSIATALLAPPFFLFSQSNSAAILESWKAGWSPYHIVDEAGMRRRLIKATIELPAPMASGLSLVLSNPEGAVLDSENIPPEARGAWAHGFWVPIPGSGHDLQLSLKAGDKVVERRAVSVSSGEATMELPLRVDRLGRDLLRRLEKREDAAALEENRNLPAYLEQHDVVFRQPSPGWDEGLSLIHI